MSDHDLDPEAGRATRQDLIEFVAKRHGIHLSEAKALVFSVLSGVVYLADHNDYLLINGFGRFENRERKGRVHKNDPGRRESDPAKHRAVVHRSQGAQANARGRGR